MNLIYLLGSLAGVGLLVGLNVLLMGRAKRRVDLEAAKALLTREQPGFRIRHAVAARDGAAALVEDETGSLYLVVGAGADLVSRKLMPASLKTLTCEGATLSLRLCDLTFPRASMTLDDEAAARDWQARLTPLMQA